MLIHPRAVEVDEVDIDLASGGTPTEIPSVEHDEVHGRASRSLTKTHRFEHLPEAVDLIVSEREVEVMVHPRLLPEERVDSPPAIQPDGDVGHVERVEDLEDVLARHHDPSLAGTADGSVEDFVDFFPQARPNRG
jgi:hypothetical protein